MLNVSISLGFQVNLEAQDKRVSMKDKREGLLSTSDKLLNPGDPEQLKRIEEVRNPFEPYVEPTIEPDPEPVTKTQPKQINEKLILMQVPQLLYQKQEKLLKHVFHY